MRILLDSHTLIWAVDDPAKVSQAVMNLMQFSAYELLVSAATIWEMAIKVAKGKLPLSLSYRPWMDRDIGDLNLTVLPITLDHAERQISLPFYHRDPFDRLLAAQSLSEGISLASMDTVFDSYGVARIWD